MATVEVRNPTGKVVEKKRELPAPIFEAPVNTALMHQVVVASLAAQRAGTHATKTRGDVRGGGTKPWRQKGTGRARQGSIRAPHWTGGGIVHGPHPRDHSVKVNKKMKRAALRSALTDAAQSGKLAVLSELAFEGPRTKDAVDLLETLDLEGAVLLVIPAPDEAVEKSFRNLPQVKVEYPGNLSTYDVLYADRVLFTTEALDALAAGGKRARDGDEEPVGDEPTGDEPPQGDDNPEMPEEAGV